MFDEKIYACNIKTFNFQKSTKEFLTGLRIKGDSVFISGNDIYQSVSQNIKICKKGTKNYISEDELYFTNDTCDRDEILKTEKTSGKFNFITQQLDLTLSSHNPLDKHLYFEFNCEKRKDN